MKITRKFLSKKYDELYQLAIIYLQNMNPCHIKPVINRKTNKPTGCMSCNGYRKLTTTLCCGPFDDQPTCVHLGKKGCKVKSLRCRTWFCQDLNDGMMPSVNFPAYRAGVYLGVTMVPIRDNTHLHIIKEMKKYRFHLLFREGKTKAVEEAYQSFQRGDSEVEEAD